MGYRDHNERALAGLDRWLTTPPEAPEPPEEAYCTVCSGWGNEQSNPEDYGHCEACNDTGIDPVWWAEYQAAAKEEADAEYAAYLESQQYEKDLDDYRKEEGE